MFSLLMFFLLISTGSIAGTVFFNRQYEETLPLTLFSIVLTVYSFGLLGMLKTGVYFCMVISILLYFLSIYRLLKSRKLKEFTAKTFTPAFFIFVGTIILIAFSFYGRVPYIYDEFSHWADTVKVLYTINDFSTNPLANSIFATYPPAMSVFQYFILTVRGEYVEWLLNFSYMTFSISLFMPFLKNLKFRNVFSNTIMVISLYVGSILFYPHLFHTLYIDPFLGILFGFGLAYLFTLDKISYLSVATISAAMAVLVLTKETGLFFAIVLGLISIIIYLKELLNKDREETSGRLLVIAPFISIGAILAAKVSWNLKILFSNLSDQKFSSAVDFPELMRILSGHGSGYRVTVVANFIEAFFSKYFYLEFDLTHFQIFIVFSLTLFFIAWLYARKSDGKKKIYFIYVLMILVSWILYIIGLLVTYLYKFPENEALQLAAMTRYMSIYYTAVLTFILLSVIFFYTKYPSARRIGLYFILIPVLVVTPWATIGNFISRYYVKESVATMSDYSIIESIDKFKFTNKRIFVLTRKYDSFEGFVIQYHLRPNYVVYDSLYETKLTPLEWGGYLKDNYDYLLIESTGDGFKEDYGSLFLDEDDIADGNFFDLKDDSGLLVKVGL